MKSEIFWGFILFLLTIPLSVFAVCPVCSIAVAGGVGLSRWLGVDDVISGIWIGGLIVSLSLWALNWLEKRKINFPLANILVLVGFYLVTILPLYKMKIIGYSCNKLWGFDFDLLYEAREMRKNLLKKII